MFSLQIFPLLFVSLLILFCSTNAAESTNVSSSTSTSSISTKIPVSSVPPTPTNNKIITPPVSPAEAPAGVAPVIVNKNVTSSAGASAPPIPTTFSDNDTDKCVCDGALLPRVNENGKEVEICSHCKCKYENRNTTLIKVVVIIVIWIISILVIYMLFLMCLDPLLNKRVKANYQEHTNEDDDTTSVTQQQSASSSASSNAQEMNPRGANVLNRVGHQQDKWKKQVREQRRNIYDRRTMLN